VIPFEAITLYLTMLPTFWASNDALGSTYSPLAVLSCWQNRVTIVLPDVTTAACEML
jgi:hypothetical protein